MTRLGLGRPFDSSELNFFNFFNSRFPIISNAKVPLSINQFLAYVALIFNKLFYSRNFFSIYFLSGLYYLIYVFGFYILLNNTARYFQNKILHIVFIIICIIIFSDVMFTSYFNSFYQESVFLIAGLYVFGILLNKKVNYNWLFIALLILSLSKIQNLIFLIFPLCLVIIKWHRLHKILILVCTISLISFVFIQVKGQQKTNEANIYEAVFLGVLLKADKNEQVKVLRENGLKDPDYLRNVGRGYWRPKNDIYEYNLNEEFYSKISNGSILKMYFFNPELFIKTGIAGIKHLTSSSAQVEHLGNLSPTHSPNRKKTIVKTFLGNHLSKVIIPGYFGIFLFYLLRSSFLGLRKENLIAFSLLIFIPLVFVANFVAGGINDFIKHNLSVYFMFSLLFVLFSLSIFKLFNFKIR